MHNEPFIVITVDPPAPPQGPPGTRWGYKFWQGVEDRARQRELRNRKLRLLKELALTLPHAPQFVTFDDPTLPPDLRAWPVML